MTISRSGDYALPGPFTCLVGNCVLRLVDWVPSTLMFQIVRRRSTYQVLTEELAEDSQGVSARKLEAMRLPNDLRGKSMLDLGCAEGFFCTEFGRRGAKSVLGVDSSLGRLLYGSAIAGKERLNIRYRMGVFPGKRIEGAFDYVLCLSLLHHSLSQKNVWKVLALPQYVADAETLKTQLSLLRSVTAQGGTCIVEMPYEYEDPAAERQAVDFELFSHALIEAGFSRACCLGTWDFNPKHREFKDRILYLAEA